MNKIDLFTDTEVKAAQEILNTSPIWEVNHKILNDVVTEETMARIDRETGQQNDRLYMAYRLQHIILIKG